MAENRRQQEELESQDRVLYAGRFVEWLVEDGPMGDNNNEVWDWEGNSE